MMRRRTATIVVGLIVLIMTAACSGDSDDGDEGGGDTGGSGGATVAVTEKDFSIAVAPGSAAAGDVSFDVTNDGPSVHEFVVFQTALAPDELPLTPDGLVDEEGEGLTPIDEIEDIDPGANPTLDVSLEAGSYVLICNIEGHYAAGMHTAFTVE